MDILIQKYRKYNKSIKISMIMLIIILSLIYLRLFFQTGILYDDVFLVQKKTADGIEFQGKSRWGDIKLGVNRDYSKNEKVTLDYQLPNGINKKYSVEITEWVQNNKQKVKISDDSSEVIFQRFYTDNSGFIFLTDESDEIIFPEVMFYIEENPPKNPYDSEYEITPNNIVSLATKRGLDIRGDYPSFLFAIMLLIITTIDIKFPLFFFQLDTFLKVEDAKPSEFFLTMQRTSWYIMPIISLILFIVALA